MYSPRKRPLRIGIGLKCMFTAPNFSWPAQRKKIRPITLIVRVLGRVEKCLKKGQKNFKQISNCDTCFRPACLGLNTFKNFILVKIAGQIN